MSAANKSQIFLFLLGVAAGIIIYFLVSQLLSISPASIQTIFSPENGDEIISFIDSAKQSLDIEMYVFTSDEILKALKRASDRGVAIRIILEKRVINSDNQKNYNELKVYGINVKWASQEYALTHAKFMILDGKIVLVGSHNFSEHAMYKNREASVIIQAANAVSDFKKVFEEDWIKAN